MTFSIFYKWSTKLAPVDRWLIFTARLLFLYGPPSGEEWWLGERAHYANEIALAYIEANMWRNTSRFKTPVRW